MEEVCKELVGTTKEEVEDMFWFLIYWAEGMKVKVLKVKASGDCFRKLTIKPLGSKVQSIDIGPFSEVLKQFHVPPPILPLGHNEVSLTLWTGLGQPVLGHGYLVLSGVHEDLGVTHPREW